MRFIKSSLTTVVCAFALLNCPAWSQNVAAQRTSKSPAQSVSFNPNLPAAAPNLKNSIEQFNALSVKGAIDAPITIVEFSDMECPFCRRAATTMQQVTEAYPGKIRIIFKHAPLDFHKRARTAHQALLAAGMQGKFWEMHDLIFAAKDIGRPELTRFARELKLDEKAFADALDSEAFTSIIERDISEARALGVDGRPTFFINGRKLDGAKSFDAFKTVIDEALNQAQSDAALSANTVKPDAPPTALLPSVARQPLITPVVNNAEVAAGNAIDARLTKGARTAPVRIVWFSDLQSSLTPKAAALIAEVMKDYPGKIQIQFKHRPLETRPHAVEIHEAALAAAAHDKFWEMHDLILAHGTTVTRRDLTAFAAQLNLPVAEFASALDKGTYRAQVEADLREARRREVRGNPVFFVGDTRIDGLQPAAMLREIIERELLKSNQAQR